MPGPAEPSHPAPSIFLSYASENRAAVRQIRDALTAAGIEAWYDENELTGGEAWDQKIRRQIRDCTYFMPIISAQASGRLEGYFRREWRLAIERSLDMADDVVFLLPVVIDDTPDAGARVPEKFLTVQWLRLPGGVPTPAFGELTRRLAASGDQRLHLAPAATRSTGSAPRPPQYLPPLHDDPGPPKEWWRAVPYFWAKLPRFVRICGWCIILISAMNMCSRISKDDPSDVARRRRPTGSETTPATPATTTPATTIADVPDAKAIKQSVQDALMAARAMRGPDAPPPRAPDLDMMAFNNGEHDQLFQRELFGKFVTTSGVKARLSPAPLKGTPGDAPAIERGRLHGARFVLSGVPAKLPDGSDVLRVKLERVADGAQVWTGDVRADENPQTASARIFAETLPFVLKQN